MAAASTSQRSAAQSDVPITSAGRPFTYFIDSSNKSAQAAIGAGSVYNAMIHLDRPKQRKKEMGPPHAHKVRGFLEGLVQDVRDLPEDAVPDQETALKSADVLDRLLARADEGDGIEVMAYLFPYFQLREIVFPDEQGRKCRMAKLVMKLEAHSDIEFEGLTGVANALKIHLAIEAALQATGAVRRDGTCPKSQLVEVWWQVGSHLL